MKASLRNGIAFVVCAVCLASSVETAAAEPPVRLSTFLTNKKVSSATAAAAATVTTVKDGDPLFLYLEVSGGSLADVASPAADEHEGAGHDLLWLTFVHGKAGEPKTNYAFCSFALTKAEANRSVIALSFAPGDLRPAGSLDCFLNTASNNKGVWQNEFRFESDRIKNVRPMRLTIDVKDGVGKYKALWKSYQQRIESGSVEFNTPPAAIDIRDAATTKSAKQKAAAGLGAPLKRFYFTDDTWFETTNEAGNVVSLHTTAAMTYKLGPKCYFEVLDVTKSLTGAVMRAERTSPKSEITCDKM